MITHVWAYNKKMIERKSSQHQTLVSLFFRILFMVFPFARLYDIYKRRNNIWPITSNAVEDRFPPDISSNSIAAEETNEKKKKICNQKMKL